MPPLSRQADRPNTTSALDVSACGCGHAQDSHHRGVAICRKISCPCSSYHPHALTA